MNAQIRRQIMERLKAERPEPESELNHNNAFELLIAVMLSAQATDKSVNLATPALFAAMPDAVTMAQKTPEDVVILTLAFVWYLVAGHVSFMTWIFTAIAFPVTLIFSRLGVATFRRLTDTMFRNVLVALMVVSAFSILAREFLV